MSKICAISTRALSIKTFFLSNLFYMVDNGHDVSIICEPDEDLRKLLNGKIHYIPIKMKRGDIDPINLIRFIHIFYKVFKREKFDLIQYTSCNASLYASIAGSFAGIKHRIACEWGYTYIGYHGLKRFVYKTAEHLICLFSTVVQPDSFSNLEFGIQEGLFPRKKAQVVWHGSACGIDFERFDISKKSEWRKNIRDKYNISESAFVFGFVGRLMKDKGINELFGAYRNLNKSDTYLLLIGPVDELQDLDPELTEWAFSNPRIIRIGLVSDPEKYYSALDFLVLPSYREGFGMVLLESAAMMVPSIATNIRGPKDFIRDGENGLMCEARSTDDLLRAMSEAVEMDEEKYEALSRSAYDEVNEKYDNAEFRVKYLENKLEILGNH